MKRIILCCCLLGLAIMAGACRGQSTFSQPQNPNPSAGETPVTEGTPGACIPTGLLFDTTKEQASCCEGLGALPISISPSASGSCPSAAAQIAGLMICSACGDSTCSVGENICNCPQDCGAQGEDVQPAAPAEQPVAEQPPIEQPTATPPTEEPQPQQTSCVEEGTFVAEESIDPSPCCEGLILKETIAEDGAKTYQCVAAPSAPEAPAAPATPTEPEPEQPEQPTGEPQS